MGQFIALPDGTLLVINKVAKTVPLAMHEKHADGRTKCRSCHSGESLAAAPVGQPAIYKPQCAGRQSMVDS